MTASQESHAQRLLNNAAEAQAAMNEAIDSGTPEEQHTTENDWYEAWTELERCLGIVLDHNTDLSEETVETLLGQLV